MFLNNSQANQQFEPLLHLKIVDMTAFFKLSLLACLFFVWTGCNSSEPSRGDNGALTTIQYNKTPVSTCHSTNTWELQRECLVTGYRADIDRCYLESDIWRRNQCVMWVQNQYNLRDNVYANYRQQNYDRLTDPFYYQWVDYQSSFQRLLVYSDPWSLYWQSAYQQTAYYNKLYWNWYRQLYGYYWVGY